MVVTHDPNVSECDFILDVFEKSYKIDYSLLRSAKNFNPAVNFIACLRFELNSTNFDIRQLELLNFISYLLKYLL